MSVIETRLQQAGIVLPGPAQPPPGFEFSFAWVRVRGSRVLVSGHSPQRPDGTFPGPFGKVPSEVSIEDASAAARATLGPILASVQRAIGDLDRISAWLSVTGMVNADAGYPQTTNAINGFSTAVLEIFGAEVGTHARTAVGHSALPLNNAVVIGAELEIDAKMVP
ncbi:LysR family transcriptional regulator [Microlunatus endophyticus]|uniref:LysR family transcriptional regulator n=1 Tax=Microlunatus endophyticus TaxID=1716077 RepID=A0A917SEG6_9ACTN|nr:RidA family protein [Microlunatus endophyticus]GGL72940.1 LysR family transcriptional regulator [Microlunatus endophyticus]